MLEEKTMGELDRDKLHNNLLDIIKQNPPDWAEDKLIQCEEVATIEKYAICKYMSNNESIDINNVVGTTHFGYAGNSWLHLLNNGKRMNENLRLLAESPNYYQGTNTKAGIGYIKIGDRIFIGDGNQRTCIAKFLFHYNGLTKLHGVALQEFTIDHKFKETYECLEQILKGTGFVIQLHKENFIPKQCGKDYYSLKTELIGNDEKRLLSLENMEEIINESSKPLFFRKFFGKYKKL
jgi:hypothetical protein